MRLSLVGAWLAYIAARAFIAVIQALSLETCATISRGLAFLVHDLLHLRGKVTEENIRLAYPKLSPQERSDLTREMWEHLFLMVCEIAHLPRKVHDHNWHQHITLENKEQLFRYLLDPRPRILLTGHLGNFEFAGYATALMGMPTVSVARPLDNPFLHKFITRFRGATGQQLLPKDGSSRQVAELLEQGGMLGLLGDQYGGPKGCWVEFFGRPASCHKAIAVFPMTANAPLVITYALRRERPLHFAVGAVDVLDPREIPEEMANLPGITQWYCDKLEEITRTAPEQYWWLHRRWKDTRNAKQRQRCERLAQARELPSKAAA